MKTEQEVQNLMADIEAIEQKEETEFKAQALVYNPIQLFVPLASIRPNHQRNPRILKVEEVESMQAAILADGGITTPLQGGLYREDSKEQETDRKRFASEKAILAAIQAGTHYVEPYQGTRRLAGLKGDKALDESTGKMRDIPGLSDDILAEYLPQGVPMLLHIGLTDAQIMKLVNDHGATRGLSKGGVIKAFINEMNAANGPVGEKVLPVQVWGYRNYDLMSMFQKATEIPETRALMERAPTQQKKIEVCRAKIAEHLNRLQKLRYLWNHNAPFVVEDYINYVEGRKSKAAYKTKDTLRRLETEVIKAADAGKVPMQYQPFKDLWRLLIEDHKKEIESGKNKDGRGNKEKAMLSKEEVKNLERTMAGSPLALPLKIAAGDREAAAQLEELKFSIVAPSDLLSILIRSHGELVAITQPDRFARAVLDKIQDFNRRRIEEGITEDAS